MNKEFGFKLYSLFIKSANRLLVFTSNLKRSLEQDIIKEL